MFQNLANVGEWALLLETLQDLLRKKSPVVDERSYSIAMAACAEAGRWKDAEDLLTAMREAIIPPNAFHCSALLNAYADMSRWARGLELLRHLRSEAAVEMDTNSCNAVLKLCSRAADLELAADALKQMRRSGVRIDAATYNIIAAGRVECKAWLTALHVLETSLCEGLQRDGATGTLLAGAFREAGSWQRCVAALDISRSGPTRPGAMVFTVLIAACSEAQRWRDALQTLRSAQGASTRPSFISYKAAIGACAGEHAELGRELLGEVDFSELQASLTGRLWAFATLYEADRDTINSAAKDAWLKLEQLQEGANSKAVSTKDLAMLAWSSGLLGVGEPLLGALEGAARGRLQDFEVEDLAIFAWGLAAASRSSVMLSHDIQDLVLQLYGPQSLSGLSQSSLKALNTFVWALRFAGQLSEEMLECARRAAAAIGAAKDATSRGQERGEQALVVPAVARLEDAAVGPRVLLDFPDRSVLYKPSGWEVFDNNFAGRQLAAFVRQRCGSIRPAIWFDDSHDFGFLHRLDVPSSGLILVAKTYEAYYDLRLQLHANRLVRDYLVLCHGWLTPRCRDIRSRLFYQGNSPTFSGRSGRPSHTSLKVLAHVRRCGPALSLIAIRIPTGRTHQIRCHVAHLGHPVVCDGRYSSQFEFKEDLKWCGRNFLHRYRLAFEDGNGTVQELLEPLPQDLQGPLQVLTARCRTSEHLLAEVRESRGLRDWTDYSVLGRRSGD
eukprot:TRINITY_DN20697_c0_g1_i1.p1 TRINITY_DN20697_c0_g1~~TRINITY_DN20697_c0_g1_i1.p1  ORF type:complete len:727 (-),score=97.37 TRINITY_DN20697_c0_g1_i1:612-2792(-)